MSTLRLVTGATATNPNVHDLYLDDTGNLEFIGGSITDEAVYALYLAQCVKCRLLLVKGEWYLDQRVGTPWKESVFKKGASTDAAKRVIKAAVESTPGVLEVRSIAVDLDARSRTLTVTDLQIIGDNRRSITLAEADKPMVIDIPGL